MAVDELMEREVLAQARVDEAFFRMARGVLSDHDFTIPEYSWFWRRMADNFEASGELPPLSLAARWLFDDFGGSSKLEYAREIVKILYSHKPQAPKSYLNQIRTFREMAIVRRASSLSLDGIDRGELAEARSALTQAMLELEQTDELEELEPLGSNYIERLDGYGRPDLAPRFPFMAPSLNSITGGGLRAGNMKVVQAFTNVGKSTYGVGWAFHQAQAAEAVVLYVPTEESAEEVRARFDARISSIDRQDLMAGRVAREQKGALLTHFSAQTDLMSRIYVQAMSAQSSVAHLYTLMQRVRQRHPHHMLAVVVDTLDDLLPVKPTKSLREDTRGAYVWYKAMLRDPRMGRAAGMSLTQTGREHEKAKTARMGQVSESLDKHRKSDFSMGLLEGATRRGPIQSVRASVMKSRLGAIKHWTTYNDVHLGTCEWTETASHGEEDEPEDEA